MKAVIDASVTVKWILPDPEVEPHSDKALQLLHDIGAGRIQPIQPVHWLVEVAAVMARLRPQLAQPAVDILNAIDFPVSAGSEILTSAIRISLDLKAHVFDTLYHAVALENDAVLITADQKYFEKASRLGALASLSSYSTPTGKERSE